VSVVAAARPLPIPPFEPEEFVVVEITGGGVAVTSLVHLPARRAVAEGRGGSTWGRFEDGFPPSSWPPACRAFEGGAIYVYAGPFVGALSAPPVEEPD
jgi:hypothetical protein